MRPFVMGHPFEALAWLAANVARRGQHLRAGKRRRTPRPAI
jgi:2-keto-4-pentenoate hydratase